jgi:hypothetical protein
LAALLHAKGAPRRPPQATPHASVVCPPKKLGTSTRIKNPEPQFYLEGLENAKSTLFFVFWIDPCALYSNSRSPLFDLNQEKIGSIKAD